MNLNAIDPVSRRDAIKTLMAGAAAASLPALRGADPSQSSRKPHVFLIMTDQQKASATSIYGNQFVHTPTWARVAREGVTFNCAYGQNPICTPSRTSIMTGTYPPVHQVFCHQNHAPKNVPQLAELMREAGYHCVVGGHYESTRSLTRGWHHAIDWVGTPRLQAAMRAQFGRGSSQVGWSSGETDVGPDGGNAAVLNDELFEYLDGVDVRRQPVFLHVAYIEPHPPYFCPRGYLDEKAVADAPLPATGDLSERPEWHRRMLADLGSEKAAPADIRRVLAAYYGLVSYADEQIARLLAYLERRGILDNSWVILTSDHGDYTGEKGFYTKSEAAYDCLLHVPLVIRGPGGRWHPGQRVGHLVELLDLFPTILSAAQREVPPQAQGHDLVAWIDRGAKEPLRPATFAAVGLYLGHLKTTMPNGKPESGRRRGLVRAVRTHSHVFIRDPDTGDEAYDLKRDPLELKNLARRGQVPSEFNEHVAMLDQWERRCAEHARALGVELGDRNFNERIDQPKRV